MPGWTARLARVVLALGALAALLVLLMWFSQPLGIVDDGWTFGFGLAFLLLVALPMAAGALALVVGHHLRGQRSAPRTWAVLGAGLALLLVGMGYVTGALPREVLPVPFEVRVAAAEAPANGTLRALRDGALVAEGTFDVSAGRGVTVRLGTLPAGPYELEVAAADVGTVSETVWLSKRSSAPVVIVARGAVSIQQDHGD